MPKICTTCIYNRNCPIKNANDEDNCKAKYYVNAMWKITTHPYSFEEMRKGHE